MTKTSSAWLRATLAIVAALSAGCANDEPKVFGCSDPQSVTPNVSGTIDVDVSAPSANANVDLSVVLQLACDAFDIDETVALAGAALVDADSMEALAELNVAFPDGFEGKLVCKSNAQIPAAHAEVDLVDQGTSNATLTPLCGAQLDLTLTIERAGCTGTTTQKTSSGGITLACNGVMCGGHACGTNQFCCTCEGTPTCLGDTCESFGCD